jgi:CRISPR/Cas system-associated exonuclease Cas4 (RecB family)
MNWSFITHVTNHLTKPRFGEQKQPTLWPSGATATINDQPVGKCRRQNFIRYAKDNYAFNEDYPHLKNIYDLVKDKAIPASAYSQWIWRAGELYEQYCIDLAKESGIYVAEQVSIYIPDFNVSGKIDLITINPDTGKYHIVEVKSVYGFNANSVMGTDSQRKNGSLGEPRDSHLMQLGLYQAWYGNANEDFAEALLVYGARDTGRYAEYLVTVEKLEDEKHYIHYQPNSPCSGPKIKTEISIESILLNYKGIEDAIATGVFPERDYDLLYSEEKIESMYQAGLLTKTDKAQHEKRQAQIAEGKKRIVKPVEKGDWQCRFCEYKDICYDKERAPKVL